MKNRLAGTALHRHFFACAFGVAFFATANVTRAAQTNAPAPSAESTAPKPVPVVPPSLVSSSDVAYPEGGSGDAKVLLELRLGADGSVRSARTVDGATPFSKAAESAALTWRFEPATRDGKAVACVIRFLVTFHAPVVEEAPAIAPAPASSSSAEQATTDAPPKPPAPSEVEVHGVRLAPGESSFTRAEVRQLPGAFGDPFRAIEAMPGVTPIASGVPFFYVRGAPPGNVGYFFDGIRVPYLFHVGLGPSVIHPGMVDRVDLYPGGYPAQFGRFAGGIVTGDSTEPRDDWHGEYNVRIFDAGALVEGGFAGGKGTVLVGGRYSYTAAVFSLIAKDTRLDYRDYQTRVTYDLGPHDRVTAFSFGSYDLLAQKAAGVETVVFGSEFYRLDLREDHAFGTDSNLRTALTLGYDQTGFDQARNSQDKMLSGRLELRHPVQKGLVFRAGADVTRDAYTVDKSIYVDPEDPGFRHYDALFPARADLAFGVWTDVVWDAAPRVQITPGARVDVFNSAGATGVGVDPRISARYSVTDHFRILHAYGVVHQPPGFLVPLPGLNPGGLQGGLQTSLQASAGVEADLPSAITASATVFDNIFLNLSDLLGSSNRNIANIDRRALGSAVGFELFVRRNLSQRLGGFLTYTLSRSTRAVDNERFPSAFDRTHVLNAALAYDLGRHWRAGTRLVFYTGTPSVTVSRGIVPVAPSVSPSRDPAFYRVDLRLEKRWNLKKTMWISFVAEMLNATLNKETVQSQRVGPVAIPSVGVEGGF
jgi:hypothetical protein